MILGSTWAGSINVTAVGNEVVPTRKKSPQLTLCLDKIPIIDT